jgi:hypothetical protein
MHDDNAPSARADATPVLHAMASCGTGEWFQALYHELRRCARGEPFRHQTLCMGATAQFRQAWMPEGSLPPEAAGQGELVACAGRAMRGIVIDHLRACQADRRGSGQVQAPYGALIDLDSLPEREVLMLDEALAVLAKAEPALAELVELTFFAGLSLADIAALRDVPELIVHGHLEEARLHLYITLRQ